MFSVTVRQLRNKHCLSALRKVFHELEADFTTLKNIIRMCNILEKEFEKLDERCLDIAKKYASEDPRESGKFDIPPENKEKFLEELKFFQDREINLECDKINVEILRNLKLTAVEATALAPFIHGMVTTDNKDSPSTH